MRRSYGFIVVIMPLIVGCASGGSGSGGTGAGADRTSAVASCADPDGSRKTVQSGRVSFCMPALWDQLGPYTWGSTTGRFTLDTTGYAPRYAPATPNVRSVDGAFVMDKTGPSADPRRRYTERIGGATAELWEEETEGRFRTGAGWSQRGITFSGESNSRAEAAQQLAVYRSVRFLPADDKR